MVAGRVLGAAISPLLFAHAPAVLIALSPFLVNLVMVAPIVGAPVYFPLALAITTMQATIGFLFGSTFGPRALAWLVAKTPVSEARANFFLDLVRKASAFAIFAIPGPILGVIAGVAGIRRRTFYILVAPAQAIWVAAAYFVGEALLEWIEVVRTFITSHAFELTCLTVFAFGTRWVVARIRGGSEAVEL